MMEKPNLGTLWNILWSKAKGFFLPNLTVVLSLLYLYVTAIGMLYSVVLYRNFGIAIFDYSETGDFLLAAFKNPVALLSALLLAVIGAAIAAFTEYKWDQVIQRIRLADSQEFVVRQRPGESLELEAEQKTIIEQHEKEMEAKEAQVERKKHWMMGFIAITVVSGFVFSSLVVPYYFASKTASSIKHGETPAVDVRYRASSGSADQVTQPGLELIGATQTVVFFYDVDDKRTIVIPQSQIVSIEVPE